MLSNPLSKQIVADLYNKFPEVEKYISDQIDEEFRTNGYLVFGPFGTLLVDWIITNESSKLVDKAYIYINQLCSISNKEIKEMLKVTFFEVLTDYKISISISRRKLTNEALSLFEEVLNNEIFKGGIYAKQIGGLIKVWMLNPITGARVSRVLCQLA